MSLPYPAEGYVRAKRGAFGLEADALGESLEAIAEQLERRRRLHAEPDDARAAEGGQRAERVEPER